MSSSIRPGSRFENFSGNCRPARLTRSLEPEMELIRETALRELTEETGYSLASWRGTDLSGTLLFVARI